MINCLKGYGGHSQGWRPGYRMFSCSRNFKQFGCPWVSSTLSFLFTSGWQLCSLKYSMWWWPQLEVTPEAVSFWHQALIGPSRSCVFLTSGSDWSLWDVLISDQLLFPGEVGALVGLLGVKCPALYSWVGSAAIVSVIQMIK